MVSLSGTPLPGIASQLLDGQQRLTALWRCFHDDYPNRRFFAGFAENPPGSQQWTKAFVRGEHVNQKGAITQPL